ncbi:hypothetical protein AB6A40_007594 [Gnathostoma spinigerum]|uniref:Reverse transcriptase domain-containing protein n=1 Tax=Gnathostoma spinigerum TaxID=75299 RepID=A0ABD6ELN9_9BILA
MKGRSTTSHLICCSSDWARSLNDNKQTDIVYIDYAKAFDSVSHQKLLHKLDSYGVKGRVLLWIKSFLTDRSFCVKIGESFSTPREISSGVPQGSILGPLLFLIYVNNIADELSSTCMLFADDSKLYKEISDPTIDFPALQRDLRILSEWSKEWQLDINTDKCHVLRIGISYERPLYISDHEISPTNSVRDLGVIVDKCLRWRLHCQNTAEKAFKVANCILRAIHYKCLENYKKAFVIYCRPILEYCYQVWSPYLKSDKEIIEHVQKHFTRVVCKRLCPGPMHLSYSMRLAIFELKPLEYRRVEFDLILCYKIVNGISDIPFDAVFAFSTRTATSRSHSRELMRKNPKVNPVYNSFSFRVIRVWNLLPQNIVSATNVSSFTQRLKCYDLTAICDFVFP